jgi:hypothetical protein
VSEERLWCSVIIQALIDATSKPKLTADNIAKTQAHNWFTVTTGVTAADFEAVCLAANMDPDRVRNFYVNYRGGPLTPHSLSRIRDGKEP